MGLLDNNTHQEYYQGNDLGNYQFTSLHNIINQFEVAYVGENKIIPKINRADIAFHAQRALQELSFDTLKSCKSQEITVPASLKMILPQDYVDYTHVSWVDSSGIKHPLYYTYDTNNPFTIAQDEDGAYTFDAGANLVFNGDFGTSGSGLPSPSFAGWSATVNTVGISSAVVDYSSIPDTSLGFVQYNNTNDKLAFKHIGVESNSGVMTSAAGEKWQQIDVTGVDFIDLYAEGVAVNTAGGAQGILRVGIATDKPTNYPGYTTPYLSTDIIPNTNAWYFGIGGTAVPWYDLLDINGNASYLEWTTTDNTTIKQLEQVNVSNFNSVYVLVQSVHNYAAGEPAAGLQETNNVDNIAVYLGGTQPNLISPLNLVYDSVTWNRYKSNNPSENQDDYKDDIYWPMQGNRYGLDPQRAQANGSFYIDCAMGKIHFSSNILGKTVILDYISDSLGTDGEMQVHKFAEDAMYKCIAHAILSTSSYGQPLVPRLIKEKFAAVRKAKLRLSNLKLGELTQILRGKSKQIKH